MGHNPNVRVVLCKKRLQKTPNIGEMTCFGKWPKLATMQRLQALQSCHFCSQIKIKNIIPKTSLETRQSSSCKKRLQKTPNIGEMTSFGKWPKLATMQRLFKVDRPQTTVVAKNLSVLQLFISRMPKICAILQLVSAPLNPIPIAEHFRRSHPQCEHSCEQHIYMSKENNAKQNEDVI